MLLTQSAFVPLMLSSHQVDNIFLEKDAYEEI